MVQNKLDPIKGIERHEDARIICEVGQTANSQNCKPDAHDRPEKLRDGGSTARLNGKQKHEDKQGDGDHHIFHMGRNEL